MRRPRSLLLTPLAAAALALAACHHTPDVASHGSGDNYISSEELEAAGTASVYDVILRAHGLFLRNRGQTSVYGRSVPRAVVFLGETEYGEIETLRNQPASHFERVRYWSGTEAAQKFGNQYNGGVIQLIPRVY